MDFNFYSKSQPYFHLVESSSSRNPRLIMTDAEAPEMTHLGWSVELSFLVPFLGGRKKHLLPKKALAKMGEATPKIRLCTWEIWSPGHWICKEKALWIASPFWKKKLIYWQLGAWFQIYRELEGEGTKTSWMYPYQRTPMGNPYI